MFMIKNLLSDNPITSLPVLCKYNTAAAIKSPMKASAENLHFPSYIRVENDTMHTVWTMHIPIILRSFSSLTSDTRIGL